jgi:mono/diheme cytochrome c family protein
LKTGTLGKGGEDFGPEMGFPGKYYSRNLTPTNLGNWTDGEIFRAITSGVDNKDEALFPVMPYPYYAHLDREDVMDIIAYLRSLSDIDTEVPQSISDFPMSLIINTMPLKPSFTKRPAKEDTVQYGGYLVNAAACMDCHTPVNKGQIILENAFSGGREFEMQGGTLRSSNITPDVETGIGSWTEDIFVSKFKAFVNPEDLPTVESRDYNTLMPWSMYAGMDTTDIKAIYAYLKTLKPIQNEVVKFTVRK